MKKYSLYTLVLGIFALLIVGSVFSVYFSVIQHRNKLIETAIDEKANLASIINAIISSDVWFYRKTLYMGIEEVFIDKMARSGDVRYIRIVKIDGSIQQSSIEEERWGTLEDPAIAKAITTKKTIIRDEVFEGEKIKTVIYPGYQDSTIWIAFSLKSIEEIIRTMFLHDIVATLGILAFVLLVMFLILHAVVNPLKKITLTCEEIRKGNLDVKIDVKSKTEIGELVNTFNRMLEDLKRSKTALEESKAVLEVKVKARTKELRELAEVLEEKVKERTKELQERVNELEKFHRLTVGREIKMVELKEKIKGLEVKLKEQERKTEK